MGTPNLPPRPRLVVCCDDDDADDDDDDDDDSGDDGVPQGGLLEAEAPKRCGDYAIG